MPFTAGSLLFETCELGVSSAVAPELLPDNQIAWGMNIDVRGGKPSTRPNLRNLGNLPSGLIQGCEYFGVQGGMLVASIAGSMYRLRIGNRDMVIELIPLDFRNSALVKQVWMTQTVETLVIQDGQSDAILYNGSTAPRAAGDQVPRGRQMAYGNGRLWVAVSTNEAVAGDIRTGAAGSELFFTEATYLQGGGKLFFPSPITGMAFIPVTGQSDYGALLVFGARESNAIRADITARDDWGKIPGFVTGILRSVGASAQWSIVSVNQDLYWRDSNGGLRSIRNALADEAGPGSAPISREVSRLTDFDSQQLLGFCSGVYFDNRLLMTSSPFLLPNGGVGWKDLISLDFAPLSTMGRKSQAAYNGKWNGLNFVKLVSGEFNGKNRAFALTTDDEGNNQLWEFGTGSRSDIALDCAVTEDQPVENPIRCFAEYPLRDFGQSKSRKRLARCDVWLSSVNGEVDLKVYWRSDNSVKWNLWDEATTCAKTSDPSTATPHVWKNLVAQERPQFKTFTIPDSVNDTVKYANQVGFEFQIRLVWTGRCRIHRMMVHADKLQDPDYADRSGFEAECIQDSVSENQVVYDIPTDGCPAIVITFAGARVRRGTVVHIGTAGPHVFTVDNNGPTALGARVRIRTLCETMFAITGQLPGSIPSGGSGTFTITFTPGICADPTVEIFIEVNENIVTEFTADDGTGDIPPEITVQPVSTCVDADGAVEFFVTAVHGPLEYDWFVSTDSGATWTELVDGGIYSGVNTSHLEISAASGGMTGYQYYCRVRNPDGSVDSDEVTLTVGDCGGVCACALVLPSHTIFEAPLSQYPDYATAAAVLADQVSNCVGYRLGPSSNDDPGFPFVADTSDPTKIVLTGSAKNLGGGATFVPLVSITALAGNVGVTWTTSAIAGGGSPLVVYLLYDCNWSLVGSFGSDSSGSFTITLPADGTYYLVFAVGTDTGTNTVIHGAVTVTPSTAFVFNPVIALYDDSGTTRNLEACPKMLLPILTESTGELQSDCANAQDLITNQVIDCLAFSEVTPFTSGSASGVEPFTVSILANQSAFIAWASLNGAKDDVWTFTFTRSPGSAFVYQALIYDYAGTLIETLSAGASPLVSSALTYSGRYIVKMFMVGAGATAVTATVAVSSSGVIGVNPIQVLYESGLDCPARLNCDDACP